jgi:hypothetical protein
MRLIRAISLFTLQVSNELETGHSAARFSVRTTVWSWPGAAVPQTCAKPTMAKMGELL